MPRGRIYKHPTVPLHLNIPRDLHAVLRELSELTRTPASRIVALMLVENQPTFVEMVAALHKAQAGSPDALEGLNRLMCDKINEAVAIQSSMGKEATDAKP